MHPVSLSTDREGMTTTHPRKTFVHAALAVASLGALLLAGQSTASAATPAAATEPAAAVPAAAGSLPIGPDYYRRYELSQNRWALNIGYGTGDNSLGADAVVWSWTHRAPNDLNSQWETVDVGEGYRLLMNRQTRRCLDVAGSSYGAQVEQQRCTDYDRGQHWKLDYRPGGGVDPTYSWTNRQVSSNVGEPMVMTADDVTMGAKVRLQPWYNGTNQKWYVSFVPGP